MNKQLWFYAVAVLCAGGVPSAHAQDGASGASAVSAASAAAPATQTSSAGTSRKAMKAADRKLAYAVRKGIEHVKGLDATRITIVARDGKVTLTGSVPQESQIDMAVEHARVVPGVTSVVSRLEVGELGP
jgi:hyperosmotically inducible protein